jgi:recombination protein RecA
MSKDRSHEVAFAKLTAALQSDYGDNSVMLAEDIPAYNVVSSGSIALDYAIGIGGVPTNRVLEICGAEGTGKTTLALHMVNSFLETLPDSYALYIDMENRLTPDWVSAFVKHSERVLVVKPDHAEQATDMYVESIKKGIFSVCVFDSIGGAPSQRVTNKSAESGNIGGNALAITRFSQFAEILSGKYDCCTIGINQVREDMGGYRRLVTPGGRAWKHACSLRIELRKGKDKVYDKINGEELQVGYPVVARIHKNSLAAPHRTAWYWFYNVKSKYGFGIDQVDELTRLGILTGVIEQGGAIFRHSLFPDGGKLKGRARVLEFVKENETERKQIVLEILEKLKVGVEGISGTFDPDEEEETGAVDFELDLKALYKEDED